MANKKIKILPRGPYLVDGDLPLQQAVIEIDGQGTSQRWGEGKKYENHPGAPYCLCRCGHSTTKPYCDGSHAHHNFEGEELAGHRPYLEGCRVYTGGTLDMYDNESLCASMRFCDRAQGVWQAVIDSADPASRELALEECAACAAGRLTLTDKEGNPIEPELPAEVCPIEDTAAGRRGPLWVKGGVTLEGADGQAYEVRNRMTLCRCGESKNMPFCDISHMDCPHMQGFDD